jgi:hypothetical protein
MNDMPEQEALYSFLDDHMPNDDDGDLADLLSTEYGLDPGDALGYVEAYRKAVNDELDDNEDHRGYPVDTDDDDPFDDWDAGALVD